MLRYAAVDWIVANHKLNYADCFDVHQLNAMFFNVCNAVMYDRRGVKRNTDIGVLNHRWNLMQTCCSEHLDPVGFLNISFTTKTRVVTCFGWFSYPIMQTRCR